MPDSNALIDARYVVGQIKRGMEAWDSGMVVSATQAFKRAYDAAKLVVAALEPLPSQEEVCHREPE